MDTKFIATVNVPGYLPMDDDPPVFDTAHAAWEYLAHERERAEDWAVDDGPFTGDYSKTVDDLLKANGTGVIYGSTPGYHGDHDLGLAYCVTLVED